MGVPLCVNLVVLTAVLADSNSARSGRIDDENLIVPSHERIVNVPRFAACFDRNSSRCALGPELAEQVR
jgi:hypothetical protein